MSNTVEKPFTCYECGFRTSQLKYLRKHVEIHTGEKPFKCSTCGFRTRAKSSLKRHKRRHTDPLLPNYKCKACADIFDESSDLRKHIKKCHLLPPMESASEDETVETDEKPLDSKDERWFPCDVCSFKGFGTVRLIQHREQCHPERYAPKNTSGKVKAELPCDYCDFMTINAVHMRGHRVRCHPETLSGFPCDICSFRSPKNYLTVQHKKDCHPDDPNVKKPEYPCDFCSYRGRHQFLTNRHKRKCHPETPGPKKSETQSGGVPCDICAYRGNHKYQTDRHKKDCHPDDPEVKQTEYRTRKIRAAIKKAADKMVFPCHMCSFRGSDRSDMERHWKEKHGHIPQPEKTKKNGDRVVYPCHLCSFRCSDRSDMVTHLKAKHPDGTAITPVQKVVYPCHLCPFRSADRSSMDTHWKAEHSNKKAKPVWKRYVCHICKFETSHPKYMLGHMKTTHETNEKDPVPRGSEIRARVVVQDDQMFLQIPIPDPQNSDRVELRFEVEDDEPNADGSADPGSSASEGSSAGIVVCDYFTGAKFGESDHPPSKMALPKKEVNQSCDIERTS